QILPRSPSLLASPTGSTPCWSRAVPRSSPSPSPAQSPRERAPRGGSSPSARFPAEESNGSAAPCRSRSRDESPGLRWRNGSATRVPGWVREPTCTRFPARPSSVTSRSGRETVSSRARRWTPRRPAASTRRSYARHAILRSSSWRVGEDGSLMSLLDPGQAARAVAARRDLVAWHDAAGSMSGEKLDQAKAALVQLLGTLRPSDRFRVITFTSDVRRYAPAWTDAAGEHVRDAQQWVRALSAEGGTNIAGALGEAFAAAPAEGALGVV